MKASRVGVLLFGIAPLLIGLTSVTTTPASAVNQIAVRCASAGPSRIGKIGGIQLPRPTGKETGATCLATTSGASRTIPPAPAYIGNPPLTFNGGSVMGTSSAVVVTPIYWAPTGFSYPSTYQSLTEQFLTDVAHDDGSSTNVFSNLEQYNDASAKPIMYDLTAGTAINDSAAYPISGGCTPDTGAVYADNSGYSACLTDNQIATELSDFLTLHILTSNLNHLYLVFLPKGVESCFTSLNNAQGGTCTISAPVGAFCGYHSYSGSTIYADLPYPVVDSPDRQTCSSDGGVLQGGGPVSNQSPNGNLDADSVISVMSHEMNEAITDPQPPYGWLDSSNNEIGDDCAYIYGDTTTFGGTSGSEYNQTINGHHYFIQEEFSNLNYSLNPAESCSQGLAGITRTVTFDANGGSSTMAGDSDSAPAALTANSFNRTGYRFAGWNSAANGGGVAFADGATYAFSADVTLYAQWAAIVPTAPTMSWATPSPITYGTALNGAQLDATASVAGSFSYSPPAGTVLGAGTATLRVTFNPTDSIDYSPVTATVPFTVNPEALQITASSTTMGFGGVPSSVSATFAGFVNGDSPSSLTTQPACVTLATRSTPAGTHSGANTCAGAVDSNYAIGYSAGSVTIIAPVVRDDSKTLTITAGTKTADRLTCSLGVCTGTLSLTQSRVTHVKKGKRTVSVTKTIVLGHKSYSISAGKSATEMIALNGAGKLVLNRASRAHPLRVTLEVVVNGGITNSITVKIT